VDKARDICMSGFDYHFFLLSSGPTKILQERKPHDEQATNSASLIVEVSVAVTDIKGK
jgi:hypothetical protein